MAPRSILITGCSSGIGQDAALTLHARGWQVFASCRREEDCAALRAKGLAAPRLDLRDPASIDAALAEVLTATGGTLDALFNNAAFAVPGAVEDLPTDALRDVFEVNLFGTHHLTRAVIPVMRAQGGHGRIVQCSSVLGLVAMPWRGAYNATKFALEALSDTLRLEMRDTDIRVALIEPGPIGTAFRANAARAFAQWIDWRASPRAAQYEASLIPRLHSDTADRFQLPPAAVTAKLIHALEAPRPHPRYFVTRPTYVANLLRRVAPTRLLDHLFSGM